MFFSSGEREANRPFNRPFKGLTSTSILMRVILWKGSSRKDMKGSLWQRGDSCRRPITPANCALFFLRSQTTR